MKKYEQFDRQLWVVDQLHNKLRNEFGDQLWDQLRYQLQDQLGYPVLGQLLDRMRKRKAVDYSDLK